MSANTTRTRSRFDYDGTVMAGITRPLQMRTAARRRERRRAFLAGLAIVGVVTAITFMLLALPLIAVP